MHLCQQYVHADCKEEPGERAALPNTCLDMYVTRSLPTSDWMSMPTSVCDDRGASGADREGGWMVCVGGGVVHPQQHRLQVRLSPRRTDPASL